MFERLALSWIATWLPGWSRRLRTLRLGAIERTLRDRYDRDRGEIETRLHGFRARINGGNPYPFYAAQLPEFNRALVDLVSQTSQHLRRTVNLIDIGAAIGDTVLLLQQRAPHALAAIHSVEPQPSFVRLFRHNTGRFPNVILHEAMLSSHSGYIRSLVHNHAGTATSAGEANVAATTVDDLLLAAAPRFDVLKIDIDGSDGEALAGASKLLERDHPAVIFEWHPALIKQAGHDAFRAFQVFEAAGYNRLLWFRNDGPFSHFSTTRDPEIATWHEYLLRMQPHGDPHFDIVALPRALEVLAAPLASRARLPASDLRNA